MAIFSCHVGCSVDSIVQSISQDVVPAIKIQTPPIYRSQPSVQVLFFFFFSFFLFIYKVTAVFIELG
jgi:hypothetical protein